MIGIKSALKKEQLQNKIVPGLKLLEIYLNKEDYPHLPESLEMLNQLYPDLIIMLHTPLVKTQFFTLSDPHHYIGPLIHLCQNFDFIHGIVAHIDSEENTFESASIALTELRKEFLDFDKYVYLENCIWFCQNKFIDFLDKNNVQKVCFDFAHFGAFHTNEEFYETLAKLQKYDTYYHVSDIQLNSQIPIPLNIGKGNIDFSKIPITFGIVETLSTDEDIGIEMKEDYAKLLEIA